jgi:hypothetical protein
MSNILDKRRLTDPDNIPTRVVNGVVHTAFLGGLIEIVLSNQRFGIGPEGQGEFETAIAARLRFDVETAKTLRNVLDAQIEAIAGQPVKAKTA